MIVLYQSPPLGDLASLSPFCTKVETYLRIAGLEYKTEVGVPPKGPKGKVPWIVEDDGSPLGDSQFIIEHLEKNNGHPVDGGMDAEQAARARAVRRMLEEGPAYFGMMYLRVIRDEAWRNVAPVIKSALPPGVGGMMMPMFRKMMRGICQKQGVGRHSEDEVVSMICGDFDAVSALLGEGPFFCGEQPRSIDGLIHAWVAHNIDVPWDSPEKEHISKLDNLVQHRDRIAARYWKQQSAEMKN